MTPWRGQKTTGASRFPSALRQRNAGDLNFDERELGSWFFAIAVPAASAIIVLGIVFGYRVYVALAGLPAVPAF